MSSKLTIKKIIKCSLVTAGLLTLSQGAFAHTRFEISTILEKSKVHNRVNIGHGCPPTTARRPTYGTNVIFPNATKYTPIIGIDSTGANTSTSKVYTTKPASDFYTPTAIGTLIRTGGPFPKAQYKADALDNIDGFWVGGTNYDQTISTPIQVDFAANAITINPTSCARSITFYAAIADFCDSATVPSAVAADENVLYWSPIPNFTGVPGQPFGAPTAGGSANGNISGGIPAAHAYSNYDGYSDAAHTIAGDGWGSPATLKVVRNTTGTPATNANGIYTAAVAANPLPAGCTGNAGLGDDIHIYPSAEQINAEMPIWTGTKQNGTQIWK